MKGPKSRKKASKRLRVAPRQKVAILAGGLAGWLGPREAQRCPVRPRQAERDLREAQAKKWPVLPATHLLGSHFLKGPNSRKKASKRPLVAPSQTVASFTYQQLTYWEAAFLKGPKSRKKASERLLQRCPERPRLAGGLAGWLAEAQRGPERRPERPREAHM